VAPFIGLFGTVWGNLDHVPAHWADRINKPGDRGAGNCRRADRHAAGLFAAIPAVMFYNHFTMKVKSFASDLDDFSLEFLNISERNFT
jgi:biopolymer transport protein TolQ